MKYRTKDNIILRNETGEKSKVIRIGETFDVDKQNKTDDGYILGADVMDKVESTRGGRPPKFSAVEEFEDKVNKYFDDCDNRVIKRIVNKKGELISEITAPYTVAGLASFLEIDHKTLNNYKSKEEFFPIIKKAKAKILADLEERAFIGDSNVTMSIFCLKNHYGYVDKNETNHNVNLTLDKVLDDIEKSNEQQT